MSGWLEASIHRHDLPLCLQVRFRSSTSVYWAHLFTFCCHSPSVSHCRWSKEERSAPLSTATDSTAQVRPDAAFLPCICDWSHPICGLSSVGFFKLFVAGNARMECQIQGKVWVCLHDMRVWEDRPWGLSWAQGLHMSSLSSRVLFGFCNFLHVCLPVWVISTIPAAVMRFFCVLKFVISPLLGDVVLWSVVKSESWNNCCFLNDNSGLPRWFTSFVLKLNSVPLAFDIFFSIRSKIGIFTFLT